MKQLERTLKVVSRKNSSLLSPFLKNTPPILQQNRHHRHHHHLPQHPSPLLLPLPNVTLDPFTALNRRHPHPRIATSVVNSEKHFFSTFHLNPLSQHHGTRTWNGLSTTTTIGRRATSLGGMGWRFSQSLLGAMWRFQSQLNLQSNNEVSSTGPKAAGRSIECEELIQMVEEGVRFVLIDVRDKKDVDVTGAIQGAKSIPLPELKAALLLDDDKFNQNYGFVKPAKSDRNIVFYGQGAVKSNAALEIAGRLGYKGVLRMAGGYDEWIEKTHLDGRI